MLTGRDIVLIASIDWEPLWQSHQEIATRFAEAGNRVLFVENTGIRTPTVRDADRMVKRLRRWATGLARRPVEVAPRLYVSSPLALPPLGSPVVRAINRSVFLPTIRRTVHNLKMRDPIIFTWLPTDTALDLSAMLRGDHGKVVYIRLTDFEHLTTNPRLLHRYEEELLRTCDLVLAQSDQLAEGCLGLARHVELLPPLVNLDRFPLAPVPASAPTRPEIGYVGGIHRFFDFDLLASCARERPQWSWTLVGPVQAHPGPVAELDNVQLVGPRAHDELASWLARFDVCIVPYVNTPESQVLTPTKVNEYLAVGRPVVATDIPWVVDFQRRHHVLEVRTNEPQDFIAGIEFALLSLPDDVAARRRRAVAAMSDWEANLAKAVAHVEEA